MSYSNLTDHRHTCSTHMDVMEIVLICANLATMLNVQEELENDRENHENIS